MIRRVELDSNDQYIETLESKIKEISGASKLVGARVSFQICSKIQQLIDQYRQNIIENSHFKELIVNGLSCLIIIRRIVEMKGQESPLLQIAQANKKIKEFIKDDIN